MDKDRGGVEWSVRMLLNHGWSVPNEEIYEK